jgi:toxin ParE1/3/4
MALQLSSRAMADLEEIRIYTIENWGKAQWLSYYRQLVAAFQRITDRPELGKDRSLFVEGMRSINCESHVIFYKRLDAAGNAPVVLRIVHQSRHMPALVYYDDLDSSG